MRKSLRFFVAVFLTFFGLDSRAQNLTSQEILAMQIVKDSACFNLISAFVIINGVPYLLTDSQRVDSALALYDRKRLSSVQVLRHEKLPTAHLRSDVVVLQFVTEQRTRIKSKRLRAAKKKFKDEYAVYSNHILSNARDPILYIDGTQIHHAEAKAIIKRLKPDQVFAIITESNPMDREIFGQNARNGLVRIWSSSR